MNGSPKGPGGGKQRGRDADAGGWYSLAGVGVELVATVLLLGLAGRWLDGRAGTDPWLMIAGGGLGFVVGLWLVIKQARRAFHD